MTEGQQQNRVKCLRVFRADISSFGNEVDEDDLSFYLYRVNEFDEQGHELKQTTYAKGGSLESKTVQKFSEQGKLVHRVEELFQDDVREEQQFEYDEQGRAVEEVIIYGEDIYEKFKTLYDEQGREAIRARFDAEDQLVDVEYTYYNTEGQVARIELQDGEKNLLSSRDYSYDSAGNPVREETTFHADEASEILEHSYDEQGNRTSTAKINTHGEVETRVLMEYNAAGKPVRFVSEAYGMSPSKVIQQSAYTYDGHLASQEWYDVGNGYLLASEHNEYNRQGLLMKQMNYEIKPNAGTGKQHHILRFQYEFF